MDDEEFTSAFEPLVLQFTKPSETLLQTPSQRDPSSSNIPKNDPKKPKERAPTPRLAMRIKERTYDLNLVSRDMPHYEPMLDGYLTDYFQGPARKRHLRKLGLIDDKGNIIDKKTFKYNQIMLDKKEYEHRILKSQSERELDRDLEVEINKKKLSRPGIISNKLRETTYYPNPDFLKNYPTSLYRTALLYTEGTIRKAFKSSTGSSSSTHHETPTNNEANGLFDKAKKEYASGDYQGAKNDLGLLIEKCLDKNVDLNEAELDKLVSSLAPEFKLSKSEKIFAHKILKLGGTLNQILPEVVASRSSYLLDSGDSPSADNENEHKKERPHSARPTRSSSFPVCTDFSDMGSTDGENEPSSTFKTSVDKVIEKQYSQLSINSKSSISKLPSSRPLSLAPSKSNLKSALHDQSHSGSRKSLSGVTSLKNNSTRASAVNLKSGQNSNGLGSKQESKIDAHFEKKDIPEALQDDENLSFFDERSSDHEKEHHAHPEEGFHDSTEAEHFDDVDDNHEATEHQLDIILNEDHVTQKAVETQFEECHNQTLSKDVSKQSFSQHSKKDSIIEIPTSKPQSLKNISKTGSVVSMKNSLHNNKSQSSMKSINKSNSNQLSKAPSVHFSRGASNIEDAAQSIHEMDNRANVDNYNQGSIKHSKAPSTNQSKAPSIANIENHNTKSFQGSAKHSAAPSAHHSKAQSVLNIENNMSSVEHSAAPLVHYSKAQSVANIENNMGSVKHSAAPSVRHSKAQSVANLDNNMSSANGSAKHSAAPSVHHSKAQSVANIDNNMGSVKHSVAPSVHHSKAQSVANIDNNMESVKHSAAPSVHHSKAQSVANIDNNMGSVKHSVAPSVHHSKAQSVANIDNNMGSVKHSAAPSVHHSKAQTVANIDINMGSVKHSAAPSTKNSAAPSVHHSKAQSVANIDNTIGSTHGSAKHSVAPSVNHSKAQSVANIEKNVGSVKHSAMPSVHHSKAQSVENINNTMGSTHGSVKHSTAPSIHHSKAQSVANIDNTIDSTHGSAKHSVAPSVNHSKAQSVANMGSTRGSAKHSTAPSVRHSKTPSIANMEKKKSKAASINLSKAPSNANIDQQKQQQSMHSIHTHSKPASIHHQNSSHSLANNNTHSRQGSADSKIKIVHPTLSKGQIRADSTTEVVVVKSKAASVKSLTGSRLSLLKKAYDNPSLPGTKGGSKAGSVVHM